MCFNEIYRKNDDSYFGKEPAAAVRYLVELDIATDGKALDMGCGEGRDSVFLAKKGFTVEAMDLSKYGMRKLRKTKEKENLPIKCIVGDITEFEYPEEKYDLVTGTTILDHIDSSKIPEVINGIKKTLKKRGLVCISVFTTSDPGCKSKQGVMISDCAQYVKHYFGPNELLNYFLDFFIVYYLDILELDTSHGKPHYHGIARLIARKERASHVR